MNSFFLPLVLGTPIVLAAFQLGTLAPKVESPVTLEFVFRREGPAPTDPARVYTTITRQTMSVPFHGKTVLLPKDPRNGNLEIEFFVAEAQPH